MPCQSTTHGMVVERDSLGRLTKITGPMGYYKTFSYPTFISQRVITDEDGRTSTLHFDSVGQLSSIRYSDGNEVHYEYDSLGRVTRVKSGNKNDCANLYGSNAGNPKNFKYGSDPNIGCKTYGFKGSKVVEYSYNADGQITEIRFKGATPQEDKTIGMTYDTIGRLESVTNIQGYATTYGYDDANRLTSAAYRGKEFTFTYDNADRLTTITYPASTGIVKNISYYNNDLVQQIKFEKGMDNLYQVDYWYDEANRRTRKDVTLPGDPDPVTTRFDYVYDTVDQLREVKKNNVTLETFTINPAKNRTTYTNSEDPSKNTTYTYDADDRMLTSAAVNQTSPNTTAYAYDNAGNQTTVTHPDATETTYSWNAEGRLIRIDFPDATSSTYEYDWMGMRDRVQDRFGNDVKSYWWTANLTSLPLVLTSIKTQPGGYEYINYLYGVFLHVREINVDNNSPTFAYFLVGDNRAVVALADDLGNVTDRYNYTSFGETIGHSGTDVNRILFSTEPNDQDSGLVYLRSRFFQTRTGMFISSDPLVIYGNNKYTYCSGNPIGRIDPAGMIEWANNDEYWIQWNKLDYNSLRFGIELTGDEASREVAVINAFNSFERDFTRFPLRMREIIVIKKVKIYDKQTDVIACTYWVNYFMKKTKGNYCLDDLKKSINDNLKNKFGSKAPQVYEINPFQARDRKPGHDYVYFQLKYIGNFEEWYITETNAPGGYKYNFKRVKEPDIKIKNP